MIRLDMPEFEVEMPEGTPQRVEIYDEDTAQWDAASVERWAVDGRVCLRFDGSEDERIWVDLTKCRFRWIAGPVAYVKSDEPAEGEATPRGAAE